MKLMEKTKTYIQLKDLDVYKLARKLSDTGWGVYESLNWNEKRIMGNQFIESIDSIGANIAEGYARYHYLDKVKFYYISRGSLSEACDHWLELLCKRNKIEKNKYDSLKEIAARLSIKLNNFISSVYRSRTTSLNKSR